MRVHCMTSVNYINVNYYIKGFDKQCNKEFLFLPKKLSKDNFNKLFLVLNIIKSFNIWYYK